MVVDDGPRTGFTSRSRERLGRTATSTSDSRAGASRRRRARAARPGRAAPPRCGGRPPGGCRVRDMRRPGGGGRASLGPLTRRRRRTPGPRPARRRDGPAGPRRRRGGTARSPITTAVARTVVHDPPVDASPAPRPNGSSHRCRSGRGADDDHVHDDELLAASSTADRAERVAWQLDGLATHDVTAGDAQRTSEVREDRRVPGGTRTRRWSPRPTAARVGVAPRSRHIGRPRRAARPHGSPLSTTVIARQPARRSTRPRRRGGRRRPPRRARARVASFGATSPTWRSRSMHCLTWRTKSPPVISSSSSTSASDSPAAQSYA